MIVTNNQAVCCRGVSAKCLEITLIIISSISALLLIINLFVTKWLLKYSSSVLAFEIILMLLNIIIDIFSFMLRIWRNNGTVYNTHFSSSLCISNFILVLLIINFISSIVEDVLFYYVGSYMSIVYDILELTKKVFDDYDFDYYRSYNYDDYFEKMESLYEKLEKKQKNYLKIMNKIKEDSDFDIGDEKDSDAILRKVKTLKILPWFTFNFNLCMQLLMFIFIIIIKQRISSKTDSGHQFNQNMQPSSFQNQIVNYNSNYIPNNNINNNYIGNIGNIGEVACPRSVIISPLLFNEIAVGIKIPRATARGLSHIYFYRTNLFRNSSIGSFSALSFFRLGRE